MNVLLVAAGLATLILGGDFLVRGAVALAQRLRISPMIIGLTLVGFGTSAPELVTSVEAALAGSPGIAIGNVVGSNIANVLLILGAAALIAPLAVDRRALWRDGSVLGLASLACLAVVLVGEIGAALGAALLAALLLYVSLTIYFERRAASPAGALYEAEGNVVSPAPMRTPLALLTLVAGLAATILGAKLLVTGAIALATSWGVSETIIGLTIVAVGTSMPELVTSLVAARKGQGDVAVGNVIGSNIFNILGILGATSVIAPLQVPAVIAQLDIWVMLAAAVALIVFAVTNFRTTRGEGAVLVSAYVAYVGYLVFTAPG